MGNLLTEAEVADRLQLTESQVQELRRRHGWPCVAFSRKTIRFTEAQVEEIVARHLQERDEPTPTPAIAGQTEASRRRRAATSP